MDKRYLAIDTKACTANPETCPNVANMREHITPELITELSSQGVSRSAQLKIFSVVLSSCLTGECPGQNQPNTQPPAQ